MKTNEQQVRNFDRTTDMFHIYKVFNKNYKWSFSVA